jgi:branched-chain amino acid transport system permease protein
MSIMKYIFIKDKEAMFTQIFINSIISALLLSLVAIGFNLIYNTTKVFHLAHGAMYVSSVYAFFELNTYFQKNLPHGISVTLSIILTLLMISIFIVLIEYLVYRPLYRKKVSSAISLISSLGVYLLVINIITFFFGNESISLDNNYKIIISNDYFKLTNIEIIHIIISAGLITIILLLSRTKYYTQIKAITYNYSVAEKFGINIQRTRIIASVCGTILVGIAGIMKGYEIAIEPNAGLTIVLTASVAVIIGGVNSLRGTIIACFVIALIENFSVKFIPTQWKEMLTYTLLIVVLIFYQQGLISVKQRVETR